MPHFEVDQDERAGLMNERRFERRRAQAFAAHPDPRDPEHPEDDDDDDQDD